MAAFGRLCTLFHDAETPRATVEEIGWYAGRLPRDRGPLLEAMAGSGRLLLPLREAGLNVHGVDSSEAMLAVCADRLAQAGLQTSLFRQDLAALNVPFRYGAAYIAAGAFQLIVDPVAAMKALARLRAHLVDPGLLLVDLLVPAEALHRPGAPVIEVRTATLAGGAKIGRRSETRVDIDARRMDIAARYEMREGVKLVAREDETVARTWYDEEEIRAMLADSGYREVAIESSPLPAVGADRRLIVRAQA